MPVPPIIPYSQQKAAAEERMRGGLTNALNMGGQGLASHLAQRNMEFTKNRPDFLDSSPEEQMMQMQQATAPYGEAGQRLLQPYLQQLQAQKQQRVQGILAKAIRGEPLSPQEEAMIGPKEQIEMMKVRAKPAPGGSRGQPVPAEYAQLIPQVLNANKNANAEDLALAFANAGVPQTYSDSYVQSRRESTKPTFEPESERLEAKRVAELASEIEKNYTTARNEDIRLDRMQELSDKGEVSTPLMMKTLDSIGLPIGILANPDTEEYRKLETDFIRDARDIFPGGRITNYEIQSYLKTIPTLMNSKGGREVIIRNRKLLNEAKRVKYDEYKKILKENGGKKPPNMGIMLEERTNDKIMDLEDRFKSGIEKEIEKHQQPIRMLDPQGNPVDIPPGQIERAMKAGARFA